MRLQTPWSFPRGLQFELNDLGYEFPRYPVPDGETMDSFLRKRVEEGVVRRYGPKNDRDLLERAKKQVEHELALIAKLGFAGYFLIVWDIVRFCKSHDILIQGRGSAANSAVCYALEITAIDPVGMELLFERFLSESRGEWPDIDLDLPSEEKREQAIQYVYQRYGELGAAMTANVITYRGKSAAREVGKALGFDQESLGRLSGLVGQWEWRGKTDTMAHSFHHAGFDIRHPRIAKYLELCDAYSGSAAASRTALRRHGDLPGTIEPGRAAGTRFDAGSHRCSVGQGRLRRSRHHQSGSARPWHDGGPQGLPGADSEAPWRSKWIWLSCRKTTRYIARCNAPIRSACSRLKVAPRWLPFHEIIPRGSMT